MGNMATISDEFTQLSGADAGLVHVGFYCHDRARLDAATGLAVLAESVPTLFNPCPVWISHG
jgi:hypothetical protein